MAWLVNEVIQAGGMDYAIKKMNAYRDEALAILSTLPQNEANLALEELVRYTTDRKY